ncbi:uncharacterized protein LOC129230555 [Uloborus diversus]|uniref:uncharacterized protein LOC129230555 n=1 Tax=Uloborus diversus TaxID=327109 RepID=UPI002409B3FD|nr:uncharacterized protein LOC129230555 [Uloborus diversus]
MDGIGGSLKRTADSFVLHGGDLVSAEDFVKLFENSKVKVIILKPEEIEKIKHNLPSDVIQVPNISKLHQIKWCKTTKKMFKRELSCWTCPADCVHFPESAITYKINDENDIVNETKAKLNVGDWVAVVFSDKWYPGVIENITKNTLRVSFMTICGRNKFSWPEKEDIQDIEVPHILCKIRSCPEPASTRYFKLEELDYQNVLNAFVAFNS